MPAAVPIIAAAVTTAGTAYGARSAGKSARRASGVQSRADAEAMAFEREREAEARRRWEAEQAFTKQQWDAREARMQPYRAASGAALGRLGDMLGLKFDTQTPTLPRTQAPVMGAPTAPPPEPSMAMSSRSSMRAPMEAPPSPFMSGPATSMSYMPVNAPMGEGTIGDLTRLRPRRIAAPRY